MQAMADASGLPVDTVETSEGAALGAAYLAGLAVGFWSGPEDLRARRKGDNRFEPTMDAQAAAERRKRWKSAVERTRGWVE